MLIAILRKSGALQVGASLMVLWVETLRSHAFSVKSKEALLLWDIEQQPGALGGVFEKQDYVS